MNTHIIYRLVFPNNKVYIGQTCKNFNTRLAYYKSDTYNKKSIRYTALISKSIRKYGWNNIKKEIICTVPEEFVDETERYFIKKFNSLAVNGQGYNIEDGGNKNKHHSEETKKKIGNIHRNKKVSKETRKKQSIARQGKTSPRKGIILSDDVKEKIRKTLIGRKHTIESIEKNKKASQKSYKIIYPDNSIRIINGLKKFCKQNNYSYTAVCNHIMGTVKSYKKMKFERI